VAMMQWPKEELRASRENALALAARARETKAVETLVLDVSKSSELFSHLVIVTATSSRHARALADEVRACAGERGMFRLGVEGYEEGRWVLVDLTDVVVHVFLPEVRDFYNLEVLWADAERVPLPGAEAAPAAEPAPDVEAPKPRRRKRAGKAPKKEE
jgi:ribosome-associated protein